MALDTSKVPVAKSFVVTDYESAPQGALTAALAAATQYARSVEGMITAALYAKHITECLTMTPEKAQALAEQRAHSAQAAYTAAQEDGTAIPKPQICPQIACEVIIPEGHYHCPPLTLPSNIRLKLLAGADLHISKDADEATPPGSRGAAITLTRIHDVELCGEGRNEISCDPEFDAILEVSAVRQVLMRGLHLSGAPIKLDKGTCHQVSINITSAL